MGIKEVLFIIIQYKQILFAILALLGLILMIVIDNMAVKIVSAIIIAIIILFNTTNFYQFLPNNIVENSSFTKTDSENKISENSLQEDILLAEDVSEEDDLEEEWTQGTCIGDVPLEEVSYEVWEGDTEEIFENDIEDFILPTEELLRGMWAIKDDTNSGTFAFNKNILLITIEYDSNVVVESGEYEINGNKIMFYPQYIANGEGKSRDLRGQNKKETYYAKLSTNGKICYISREDGDYIPYTKVAEMDD